MYESVVTRVLRQILDASDRPLRVIEIGTAYGEQLHQLSGCQNLSEMVSIDTMYDWVPDVKPDEEFNPERIDKAKLDRWNENARSLPIRLIIGKSHDVATDGRLDGTFDVLVVDGCHHPPEAVESDYWDFTKYLNERHIVIFDDINHGDPGIASERVVAALKEKGMDVNSEDKEGGLVRVLRVSCQPLHEKTTS